ncbi:unnamed protein product [Arabis nemorensis]|uniref:Uncharacterized protein n=1 Tax=Arabis nemorensis TaxID=586526 RepID=A0A565BWI6_9BRAS|nr:unnamed protein product [Arabis nemorensis]
MGTSFITRLLLVATIFVYAISAQIGLDAAGENLCALGLNLDLESTGPGGFDALISSFSTRMLEHSSHNHYKVFSHGQANVAIYSWIDSCGRITMDTELKCEHRFDI